MPTDAALAPQALVAGAIERYCDNLGEPMPSPALARALAHVAAEVVAQLADQKRAVYCKPCDGAPCDYDDELAPFADLLRKDHR